MSSITAILPSLPTIVDCELKLSHYFGVDGYLRQNALDNFPVNIGQSFIASLVEICQSSVIHPHKVQDGGVQIVYMHLVGFCGKS